MPLTHELFYSAITSSGQVGEIVRTAPVLEQYLNRLAVTPADYIQRLTALERSGHRGPVNELDHRLLISLADDEVSSSTPSHLRANLLHTFSHMAQALEANPAVHKGDQPYWPQLTHDLLARAEQSDADPAVQVEILQSALTASLLSDDLAVRRDFIRKVYDAGLEAKMSAMLGNSPLSLIIKENGKASVQRLNRYRAAFEVPREDLDYYLAYTQSESDETGSYKPKQQQRELRKAYEAGSMPSPQEVSNAQQASRAKPEKASLVIDPYKVERFALEEMFIDDQLKVLFPTADLHNSPFMQALCAKRDPSFQGLDGLRKLRMDTQNVLAALTAPVIKKYHATDPASLEHPTPEQAAYLRFENIAEHTASFHAIAIYMDYARVFLPLDGAHIWSIAERGAAVPEVTEALLGRLMFAAARLQRTAGPDQEVLAPTMLRTLAQSKRKHLMAIAMANVNDFQVLSQHGNIRPVTEGMHQSREIGPMAITVQSDQSTELTIPLATTKSKDIADEHHGVTLGCPAGRVGIDELRHSPERGLHTTNNLIDYLVETIIEEAHMRGHLAVSNYVK